MHVASLNPIGSRARSILANDQRGNVLSSHDTGIYCRFESGDIVLLHDARYGVIPFGLGCDASPREGWKRFLPGTPLLNDAARQSLTLGEERYSYAEAVTPASPLLGLPPRSLTAERLRAGIEASVPLLGREGIAARYMAEDVALFGAAPSAASFSDIWENALWNPLQALFAYCGGDASYSPGEVVSALIGLGPGLTPLGDDILCGLLSAGHALHMFFPCASLARVKNELSQQTAKLAPGTTTSQSVAFLRSAAAGERFGMLDEALASLFTHNAADAHGAFAKTLDTGHTSGSGLLLGVLLAAKLACLPDGSSRSTI